MPEILVGFRERFWVLAILMDTGWNSRRKELQQKGRPQMPKPPNILASSRMPICRSSMRVWKTAARLFTRPRKSTRPSEVKKKRILVPSKLHSTLTNFISSSCSRIFSWQTRKAYFSFSRFFSTTARSSWVARRITGRRGETSWASSNRKFPRTQWANSCPEAVSTMRPSPGRQVRPWGSK